MDNQKILLKIVKTWNINPNPEYRGFRCANCQKYMHKAWHHQLNYGGFKTPVHFCNRCERKFSSKRGIYKIFTCDRCNKNHFKMYHVWSKKGKNLVETHFCKSCWSRFDKGGIYGRID